MRKCSIVRFALTLLMLCTSQLNAQWQRMGGPCAPGGANTYFCFAAAPDGKGDTTLYLGVLGWLFKSTDKGTTWHRLDLGHYQYSGIYFNALAVLPNGTGGTIVFAARNSPAALLRSSDNGATWDSLGGGLPQTSILSLAVTGNTLYAGGAHLNGPYATCTTQVFRTTDKGASWTSCKSGLPAGQGEEECGCLFATGSTVFVGTYMLGIFRSTDEGATWTTFSLPYSGSGRVIVGKPDGAGGVKLFAMTGTTLYRSTNNGNSWVFSAEKFYLSNVFATDRALFLVGSDRDSLWRSTNDGDSWVGVPIGVIGSRVTQIGASGSTLFACKEGQGVFRSTDGGLHWTLLVSFDSDNTSPFGLAVLPLDGQKEMLYASTRQSGVFFSADEGSSWEAANDGLSFYGGSWLPDPAAVAVSIDTQGEKTLFQSGDGGIFRRHVTDSSWEKVYTNSPSYAPAEGLTAIGTTIFAGMAYGASSGVLRSTDDGTTWTPTSSTFKSLYAIYSLAAHYDAGSGLTVFAGDMYPPVYCSTDSGGHWNPLVTGMASDTRIYALAVADREVYAGTSQGVYRSTDEGATWGGANTGLLAVPSCFAVYSDAQGWVTKVFAGTGAGVHIFDRGSGIWRAINSGLTGSVISLAVGRNYLYAGTSGSGVFRHPLLDLVAAVPTVKENRPTAFALEQNYPNPFNPVTRIKYAVGGNGVWGLGDGAVTLKVYDLLGREVAVLVNERKAPGSYEVSFNASGLSSGVYLCRMTAGAFMQTKAMMLVK